MPIDSGELLLETLHRIESKVDAIPSSLAAIGERVAQIEVRVDTVESRVDKTEQRQWIHSGIVVPIVGAFHLAAKKLGW